jgi:membrane-bound PQQ-dependent dehydrogenase (glucose/quinate/shikimate family)
VSGLKVAWIYRTADLPTAADATASFTFEATPINVGQTLYLCTPYSKVIALDADTGKPRWRFDPHVRTSGTMAHVCRGVAYFEKADAPECPRRILAATIDARLMALDADTGSVCNTFGTDGFVNLKDGMGFVRPGYVHTTSAPTVTHGLVVLGGLVLDGQEVGEPSGVVRAFDATTGKLAWAWDLGRPGVHGEPPPGGSYTRGTPNAWAPFSADEALGLIYVPTGNSTPDFVGSHRSALSEKFSSSIVALDATTGDVRWAFQTVHHDLWDFDVPAQPVLIDFPTAEGKIPAVVQATKRGEIFILDRRDGRPLTKVEELPAPQSPVEGDWTSPTQPYSLGFPEFAGRDLNEDDAWGLTPLDQLWCRIQFKKLRYDGQFTPPSLRGSLQYPGIYGVIDWGGISIDTDRGILTANTSRVPFIQKLLTRVEADGQGVWPWGSKPNKRDNLGVFAQAGTPYASIASPFLSPLGIPCIQPPWGELTAVDLATRKILWRKTLGTGRDTGPLGLTTGLPINFGVPGAGGPLLTGGGVLFVAATLDREFRAFDTKDGNELWHARLPAGGQASPITYISAQSGRQFVVIDAGGHSGLGTKTGDYVIAYALPAAQ